MKAAKIEQGRSRQNIDQQVEITVVMVNSESNGTEYTCIAGAVRFYYAPDQVSIGMQRLRRLHNFGFQRQDNCLA